MPNLNEPIDWSKLTANADSFRFTTVPHPVGYWVLYPQATTNTKFAIYQKPTLEQIQNTEQLLGWGWEDIV